MLTISIEQYVIYALLVSLLISISLNLYLIFKKKERQIKYSMEAEQLLSDLTAGRALVQVTPIDPRNVFYRGVRK